MSYIWGEAGIHLFLDGSFNNILKDENVIFPIFLFFDCIVLHCDCEAC